MGDINNDGKIDIVVTRGSQAPITANATTTTETTSNDDLSVLLGNGDGTFKPAVNSFLLGPQNGFSNTAWLVDMNRDGKLDLVGDWGVALGKGDGTFQSPKAFNSTLGEIDVGVGDLNGDGIEDIVLWETTGYIQTLLGDGTGGFAVKATNWWANTTITDLKVGKIYGGSERDLVFSGSTANGPVVIAAKGNGNGELGTLGIIPLPNLPLSINFADFNRDGNWTSW